VAMSKTTIFGHENHTNPKLFQTGWGI